MAPRVGRPHLRSGVSKGGRRQGRAHRDDEVCSRQPRFSKSSRSRSVRNDGRARDRVDPVIGNGFRGRRFAWFSGFGNVSGVGRAPARRLRRRKVGSGTGAIPPAAIRINWKTLADETTARAPKFDQRHLAWLRMIARCRARVQPGPEPEAGRLDHRAGCGVVRGGRQLEPSTQTQSPSSAALRSVMIVPHRPIALLPWVEGCGATHGARSKRSFIEMMPLRAGQSARPVFRQAIGGWR